MIKISQPPCNPCNDVILQLIRDEIHAGKSDKDIYKKLENEFGETVLYAPKFDRQTAALWLSPVSLRVLVKKLQSFHFYELH